MTDTYYVASAGVLGLRTNAPGVKWSWGVNMPEASKAEYEACAVRLRYTVLDETPAGPDPETPTFGKYHYFHGEHGADLLHYRRAFMGKRELYFRLSGLASDEIHLQVNPEYARFITHRFMNLHSPGYILTDVVGWALTRHGYAPVHCSGFAQGDNAVLVLAPPNTGKTLTAMSSCMDLGASYLAEDVAITDGTNLYAVPWTSTFRYYENLDTSRRTRALNKLTKVFPPAELLPVAKSSRIDDLLDSAHILESAPVTHVAVLERGEEESLIDIPTAEAVEKAVNLNRYEFKYSLAPVMVAYEYFNPQISLEGAQAAERHILKKVVEGAKERFAVRTRDASKYSYMIDEHLKK
jgi:hypothetical protein